MQLDEIIIMLGEQSAERVKMNNEPVESYKFSYAFQQQLMKSWRPKPTLKCAITIYVIIGLIFFALGIAILIESNQIFEQQIRYDDSCTTIGQNCTVTFTIGAQVTQPIYFFYRITSFYQNQRRYVQSISYPQLSGQTYNSSVFYSSCDPVQTNADLFTTTSMPDANGVTYPLIPASSAFPCGLVARSLFNDTFTLTLQGSSTIIPMSAKGIAWPDDINYRYFNLPANQSQYQWTDIQSERFMNWMKMSPFSDFRKTWGIIQVNLAAGTYQVNIANNWNANIFGGQKWIVLSTTNSFGGANYFLAYSYLAIGGLSILCAIVFIVRKITRPKGVLDKKIREFS